MWEWGGGAVELAPMRRLNRRFVAALAVFGVLAAGCELRADFRLELNEDESGRVLVTFGLDEEFQALAESGGGSVEDSLFGADSPLGDLPGAEQRTYQEDDFTYYEASVPFSDLNGLRLISQGDADNFVDSFNIRITEDTARVVGNLDLGEITGGDLADDQLAGIGAEALAEIFKFHIQLELPGKVTRHNADRELDDGSLEWDIPLTGETSVLAIEAESDLTDGGGFPLWLIILIVVVILGAVLVLLARTRRRLSMTPSSAPAEEVPVPTVTEVIPPVPEGEGPEPPTEG